MLAQEIMEVCKQFECGYIEFKREWYWHLSDDIDTPSDLTQCWGEFIKDFLGLVNANSRSFNQTRYLIFGFDEETKCFYDFGLNEDKFQSLKKSIINKVKDFIYESFNLDYEIEYVKVSNIFQLVIKIRQPKNIHYLLKDIQTKSIIHQEYSVLHRAKNGKNFDSVKVMPPEEQEAIKNLIEKNFGKSKKINLSSKKKSIKVTIDLYLEKNSSYEISNIWRNDRDIQKYYELYQLENDLTKDHFYFAYITDKNLKGSLVELNKCIHSNLLKINSMLLLIDKPKDSSLDSRIKYVRDNYSLIFDNKGDVEFIDEFGKKKIYREQLEPLLFSEDFPNTENFVENHATLNDKNNIYATDLISNWFLSDDNPILVITGQGGVGKTTIVKNFLNKNIRVNKRIEDKYVLFIDSSVLVDRIESNNSDSVYELYKANASHNNIFSEELFKLSLDNGSFIIVLDGLDEIISKLGVKFQLKEFLKRIFDDYCFNLGKTKIIITCRDSIWDEAFNPISHDWQIIDKITLEPFNRQQAETFFHSCFTNNISLQKRAMSLANKLIGENNSNPHYSPFVLDTIKDLVNSFDNDETNTVENLFSTDKSELEKINFNIENYNDYLIYAVCKREEKKLNIPIVTQVEILSNISRNKEMLTKSTFSVLLHKMNLDLSDNALSLLLAHPFIFLINNSKIILRYDFLKDFFLRVLVSKCFSEDISKLNDDILEILVQKVGYLNDFSKDVGIRIRGKTDDITLGIIGLVESLSISKKIGYQNYISAAFILYLGILKSRNILNDSHSLNKSLFDIFGATARENSLKNLCISNVRDIKGKPKIVFDFSDLTIDGFYLDNYLAFNECIFNENTIFKNGTLNLVGSEGKRLRFKSSNFIKTNFLGETLDILEENDSNVQDVGKLKEKNLLKFLRMFIVNGRFMSKKVAEIKSKRGNDVNSMINAKVILIHKDSKLTQEEYIINPEFKAELFKFTENGVPTPNIIKILNHT